jgi:cytidylate kinase
VSEVPVIAIDGPGGSGKGTVSRRVALALGWHLLDSGALYRLTAEAGRRAALAPGDEAGFARLALTMDVRFGAAADGDEQVLLDGDDVTRAIRSEAAGERASVVAAYGAVRSALFARQRAFARSPGLVADGRDMGSVVFPAAPLKVFLTASAEERARRRALQLAAAGEPADVAAIAGEIALRDARDRSRALAPLVATVDAVVIDSTGVAIEAVVREILALAAARGLR